MDQRKLFFKSRRKTILCRFCPVSKNEMLIKLDLVLTANRLFDYPNSLLYPNVEFSNQLSLTIDTFTDGIRAFIKDKLPLYIQEEIIQIIIDKKDEEDEEDKDDEDDEEDDEDEEYEEDNLKKPFITNTSRWELDKRQRYFIKHICIFDICSQICNDTTNNVDILISNDIIKEYGFLSRLDLLSSKISPNKNLLKWSRYLMAYNQTYSSNESIRSRNISFGEEIHCDNIFPGTRLYVQNVIDNANIYCRPRILPVENPASSSSIFQESKPDAIMNIDISIESTLLSFSLLDENGFVKEVWNHDDFLKDKSLCSLGSFFSFSEATTLNVKSSFIELAKDYLMSDVSFLSADKNNSFLQLKARKIETIICKDRYTQDLLVSTQQQMYIKAFLLLYMIYIKYVISRKLSDIIDSTTEIKIGYNITVKKILLNNLFRTKEDLKDTIYASGLIQKEGHSKKLRIVTEGERILYVLRRSSALPFQLKSYFVLAQLHENYIQLTLNQVVTEFSSDEEDPEAIIIHDKIIHIPNIYTSLCLNMWSNIVEDSSLIKLCDMHQEYSGENLLEITSLKNQAEFTENLKRYISKDNLGNNSSQPATNKIIIQLSVSCNCRVHLTVRDIVDISFQPVLQDIVSLVSASFIDKELFGKFWNIQYLFQLIQFDYNSQLHDSLIKILKDTTEDVMIERGVDIPHYSLPKSLNQLLRPALRQQPISYKEFQVGTLHHVYGDRYGFGFDIANTHASLLYKSKITDTKTVAVNDKTVLPLFKRGDIINNLSPNLTFYLNRLTKISIRIEYSKLKTPSDLNSDGTVPFNDKQETFIGSTFNEYVDDLKIGQDVPFLISVIYEAYSGSLILGAKLVGQDIGKNKLVTVGMPINLSRF